MTLQVQVVTPSGQGYLLGSEVEGLQFSNVRPGGDEHCSFTLKRSWLAQNPELRKGSIVRVLDGLDVLWQGRLEEDDRGQDGAERVEVTSYGLGARLKDGLFRMIFVDRDMAGWVGMSRSRKATLLASAFTTFDPSASTDTVNGLPALLLTLEDSWATGGVCEALLDAGSDGTIAKVYYDFVASANTGATSGGGWNRAISGCDDDALSGTVSMVDLSAVSSGSGYAYLTTPKRCVALTGNLVGAGGTAGYREITAFRYLVAYGPHGLVGAGSDPVGFTADQLVGYMVGLVAGVKARRMQAQAFVIPHFVIDTPTSQEDGITAANEFAGAVWGTWGPESVLDFSSVGYFDYQQPDYSSRGDWIVSRADTEDLDLHSAIGSLFDRLRVSWQDSSGDEHVEIRTAVVPALQDANMSPHERELDAGPGSQGSAQQTGDVFFALQGTDPPAAGSADLERRITHATRGSLPPHYMRADGSTLRITDALSYGRSISLQSIDRQTVFPIQRVDVDASGPVPRVQVDLDQASDRISTLQARTGAAGAYGDSGGYAGGVGPPLPTEAAGAAEGKKKKAHHKRRKRGGNRGTIGMV